MDQIAPPSRRWAWIALATVPGIVILGFVIGRASNPGANNIWFDALTKPAAMPPGWAFGAAWSVLDVLIGLAIARILASPPTPLRRTAIAWFLLQLILNFAWSPMVFGAHQLFGGLVLILGILAAAVATTLAFGKVDRIAAWLMVPYLVWLSFATILNFQLLQLNQ